MCEYCLTFPHRSGCPNAPEPLSIYICESCDEGITVGEEYVEINGNYYHYDCLSDNFTVKEILAMLDVIVQEAEKNEDEYVDYWR